MTYAKPEVVVLMPAIDAIRHQVPDIKYLWELRRQLILSRLRCQGCVVQKPIVRVSSSGWVA